MANLIILIGLPGAGKSTYATEYLEDHIEKSVWCSSDATRKDLYGDESVQGNPNEVFRVLHNKVAQYLRKGYDVIYDATNITRKSRKSIISLGKSLNATIHGVVVWAPVGTCVQRDSTRDRTVGWYVINKMLYKFEAPYYDEGFDRIKIHYNTEASYNPYTYTIDCEAAMKIPHDNPHHTLGVHEHCLEAYKIVQSHTDNDNVIFATAWHDIGKPLTKFFKKNKDGVEVAHYYQHQCVGAYLSYGLHNVYSGFVDSVLVPWLICNHMEPFFNSKYYKQLDDYLKNYIDTIHIADRYAH